MNLKNGLLIKVLPFLGSFLSALLFIFTLPPFQWWFLAPFILIPFFYQIQKQKSWKQYFISGFIFGFFVYVFLFYWLVSSFHYTSQNSIWLCAIIVFLLFVGQGVLFGCFGIGLGCLYRSPAYFLLPFYWVGFENLFLIGFPISMGYAWHSQLYWSQWSEIWGVYGFSFFTVLISLVLIKSIHRSKRERKIIFILMSIFLLGMYLVGIWRFTAVEKAMEKSKQNIVIVQMGVAPTSKRDDTAETYAYLCQVLANHVAQYPKALFILPESILVPAFQSASDPRCLQIKKILGPEQAIIFGGNVYDHRNHRIYNAMIGLEKDKDDWVIYGKKNLLVFGEFLPGIETFDWMKKLFYQMNGMHHYSPYAGEQNLVLKNRSFLPSVCVESMHGVPMVNSFSEKAPQAIVNVTEDGWLASEQGMRLHLYLTGMRSIELRRMLFRCCNLGVSAIINANGRIYDQVNRDNYFQVKGHEPQLLSVELMTYPYLSFYASWGIWMVRLCQVVFVILSFSQFAGIFLSGRKRSTIN